jgi:cysteine dioxygenase
MRVTDTISAQKMGTGLSEMASPLAELADLIRILTRTPSLSEVTDWFSHLTLRRRDYEQYRVFTGRKYARNLIARGEFAELLMLCWHPGQRTPIHDHGGSIGVVMVCEGLLTETMYERCDSGRVRPYNTHKWSPGGITGADVPDIHQLLNHQRDGRELVTLHCYSPPLSVLNTFSPRTSSVGRIREGYFSGGAGI